MAENNLDTGLKHPYLKWLISIACTFLFMLLIWSGCKHKKRCDNNEQSSFLWGADICYPKLIDSVKYDTIFINNPASSDVAVTTLKDYTAAPAIKRVKPIKNIIKDSIVSTKITGKNINTGTNNGVIGDNNNINVNKKVRKLDETFKRQLIQLIDYERANKNITNKCINMGAVSDAEAMDFAYEISQYLKENQFELNGGIGMLISSQSVITGVQISGSNNCINIAVGYQVEN